MMRKLTSAFALIVVFVVAAVACSSCTPKEPEGPAAVGPISTEPAVAGDPVPAEPTDDPDGGATEEPTSDGDEGEPTAAAAGDWSWDRDTPIDPASIPDAPAAGDMEGSPFVVEHAIIEKNTDNETGVTTYDVRFLDTKPEPGGETWGSSERMMEVTVPDAGEGTIVEIRFGSDEWDLDTAWFWYKKSPSDNTNPNKSASLYIEFTEWDETPSTENDQIAGTAKGKIGVGSDMGGDSVCWLGGTFEAIIKAE